jgi:hypothetical protein
MSSLKLSTVFYFGFLLLLYFAFCFAYRRPYLFEWDEFSYILRILEKDRAYPLMGRPAFNYFYISLTQTFHTVFGLDPSKYYLVVQAGNILLGAVLVGGVYSVSLLFLGSGLSAFLVGLYLIFSRSFILLATSQYTEIMAYAYWVLGLLLCLVNTRVDKKVYLYLGLAFLGLSFQVRELLILYSLPLAGYFIYHAKQKLWPILIYLISSFGGYFALLMKEHHYVTQVKHAYTTEHAFSLLHLKLGLYKLFQNIFSSPMDMVILIALPFTLFHLWRLKKLKQLSKLYLLAFLTLGLPIIVQACFVKVNHIEPRNFFIANFIFVLFLIFLMEQKRIYKLKFQQVGLIVMGIAFIFFAKNEIGLMGGYKKQSIIRQQKTTQMLTHISPSDIFYVGRLYPSLKYERILQGLGYDEYRHQQDIDLVKIDREIKSGQKVYFWPYGYVRSKSYSQYFHKTYQLSVVDKSLGLLQISAK